MLPRLNLRRLFFIAGLAYALILVGLATLHGELLALALPLVVYLGAGLLFSPGQPDIEVQRSISQERVSPHAIVEVNIKIINHAGYIEDVLFEDVIPEGLRIVDGETSVLAEMPSGGEISFSYRVEAPRGIYRFREINASMTDHLGIFERRLALPAPGRVLVLPQVPMLKRVAIRPRQTRVYSGSIPARQGGSGVEFFGVREYQPGDPMRHINWRVSARHHHTFYSNEFEQERVSDVWLILDARSGNDAQVVGESLFEHAIMATAGLAQALLNDGNRVGLLVYGGFLDWTYPGYGKIQRERIWHALARARTGESLVFEKLENLPTRVFPPQTQLILVSSLRSEDYAVLVNLRARGYPVLAISPDPISFEGKTATGEHAQLGVRFARVARELLLAQLRHADVQVINWDVSIPFDRAMQRLLTRPVPWHHLLGVKL